MARMRRSMMFVPGNNPGMLINAGIYGADTIIFCVEDSVSVYEKDAARELVANAIRNIKYPCEVAVRINHISTPFGRDDLEVILPAKPNMIRLPKAETAADILDVDEIITAAEKKYGFEPGCIRMMAAIETCKGIMNAYEIASASPRMEALAIGGEDYLADLRTSRTAHGDEFLAARSQIVVAARAAGIQAIDTVYSDINNEEGFRNEIIRIKELGFDGKSVINPRQIQIVHDVFAPTAKEIDHAERVLVAYEEALAKGSGVISLNGKMIDGPIVARAERALAYADALGMRKGQIMINKAGREIPSIIKGLGEVKLYNGAFATIPTGRMVGPKIALNKPRSEKLVKSIDQVIDAAGLKDGMTISFHHHFRNGDYVLNMVMEAIAKKGIKDLTLAPSSLSNIHEAIIPYMDEGIITAIETSGARGKLGKYFTEGRLKKPVIIRSHGGRARAIECGDLKIDVAFIGAPACDMYGNINGISGKSACGSMGYAMVDAEYADKVVAITDNLVAQPLFPISIPQTNVDFIVEVESIGDPKGIASGALRISKDPRELKIAEYAANVIEYSGLFRQDYSMQMGSGGASLAVAQFMKEKMLRDGITGSFGVGGITTPFVNMLEEGLFKMMYDVQDFDIPSIESIRKNANHIEMSASYYANPHNRGPIVNNLDFVILSATEVDVNFNVNVITDSNGVMMGASGGHCDTAAGAAVSIVVAPLLRGRLPMVLDKVQTIVTPGETVDVIVTERGVAVNPNRKDLIDNLKCANLPLMNIEDLQKIAYDLAGKPEEIPVTDDIVGVVEYRDGTIIDVIRKPV